jgi:uncharacterized protein (TIGR02246 family)
MREWHDDQIQDDQIQDDHIPDDQIHHDTIEDFFERMRAAWGAGDAPAFAGQFTDDATYVTWMGYPLIGRNDIEQTHADVFQRWCAGTRMEIKLLRTRALGPDRCIALTIGGIGEESPIAFDKLQTFVLVRVERRWLCAAFQNTAMSQSAKDLCNLTACKA